MRDNSYAYRLGILNVAAQFCLKVGWCLFVCCVSVCVSIFWCTETDLLQTHLSKKADEYVELLKRCSTKKQLLQNLQLFYLFLVYAPTCVAAVLTG